jgi:hypothetical protein
MSAQYLLFYFDKFVKVTSIIEIPTPFVKSERMGHPAAGLLMAGLIVLGMAARGATGPVTQLPEEDFTKDDFIIKEISKDLGKYSHINEDGFEFV